MRNMLVKGGYTIYGVPIGILVCQTLFPRVQGDVGNASTYDFPVRLKIVEGATDARITIPSEIDGSLLTSFIKAAQDLEKEGVKAIATSCGYLSAFQEQLAEAVSVPVFTSSLLLVPMISRMLGKNRKVGIIAANGMTLKEDSLTGAGIDSSIQLVIRGMENSKEFSRVILTDLESQDTTMDTAKMQTELVKVCRQLVEDEPRVGALVFECTNLQPYAAAVQNEIGLPIFTIVDLVSLVYKAVVKETIDEFL